MTSAGAGGVTVRVLDPGVQDAAAAVLRDADSADTAARLAARDSTLWGPEAQPEASIRLGWVDVTEASRPLVSQLRELRAELTAAGLDHIVLAGMGGSSLAPEVITRSAGVELTVLDTTDPGQVRRALADRLDRTVVVVASKSGGTVETDSHRRVYEKAFADAGLTPDQIKRRFVVVTDPGSPLEQIARAAGYRVFLADPEVGGRYSALTAFGLVPAALAGVDVAALLEAADAVRPALAGNSENPGLLLGAAMGGAVGAGRNKLVIGEEDPALVGFGDWAEQLIAESTGKAGTGVLPVVVEGRTAPGWLHAGPDSVVAAVGDSNDASLCVTGPLGGQFLVWEYATAVAGRALRINPFDQPNVTESKENTNRLLAESGPDGPAVPAPLLTDGPVEVFGDARAFDGAKSLGDALDTLLASVSERGYLAVMAYLDRVADARAAQLRPALAKQLIDRQVTFGWGPRFLHSTGQFHKGGPQVGVFLQLTGAVTEDLAIPGRPFTFGALQLAQALGDLGALTGRGRPALRLHLTDRKAGVEAVLAAIGR
jgi:glucose-6-phosphate isomerase